MPVRDPYIAIDDVLMPWAKSRNIKVATLYRDDIVRSIWVYDKNGQQRGQLWLGIPTDLNVVAVHVAELRPDLPAKWGERLDRTVPLSALSATLDEFSAVAFKWAGDGAFTGG
jgi:hypothetical protein